MNYPTVFLKILENKKIREVFMQHIHEESEFVAISKFIETEPSITKSKYITKYLNNFKHPIL